MKKKKQKQNGKQKERIESGKNLLRTIVGREIKKMPEPLIPRAQENPSLFKADFKLLTQDVKCQANLLSWNLRNVTVVDEMAIVCSRIKGRLLEWSGPGSQVEDSTPIALPAPLSTAYCFNNRGEQNEQYIKIKIYTFFYLQL